MGLGFNSKARKRNKSNRTRNTKRMNKQKVKQIAEVLFEAGKNDFPDKKFNKLFEEVFKRLK